MRTILDPDHERIKIEYSEPVTSMFTSKCISKYGIESLLSVAQHLLTERIVQLTKVLKGEWKIKARICPPKQSSDIYNRSYSPITSINQRKEKKKKNDV